VGIKFGEIDSSQILDNEFRIGVLEKLLNNIVNRNPGFVSKQDIMDARIKTLEELKSKYPESGISLKG
jgi:hypothetical protein